jgi:hypothetical protein
MKLYCGHIECKWTHNERLEFIYFRQKYGDPLFKAINTAGEMSARRYNSRTLPSDIYKHVDFYVDLTDTKRTTLFLLKWAWRLDKETIWDHTV